MPLQFVPPPQTVLGTYQQSLFDFLGRWEDDAEIYHLPVGAMGLRELAGDATLGDVMPSGCRILARWAGDLLFSCEMTNPAIYGSAEFRNFVTGDMVPIQFARITEAAGLPRVQTEDFDLHFLSVPGIHLEALHLVCRGPGSDLILPVLSGNAALATDAVLDADTFLAAARAIATARLALNAASDLSS